MQGHFQNIQTNKESLSIKIIFRYCSVVCNIYNLGSCNETARILYRIYENEQFLNVSISISLSLSKNRQI